MSCQGMFDIRNWLDPFINNIQHHTKPLHYRFSRNHDETIQIFYKGNHNKSWKTLPCNILSSMPAGSPSVIEPDFKNINLDRIEKHMTSWKPLLSNSNTLLLWWSQFVKNLKDISSSQDKIKAYALRNATWLLPVLPRQDGANEDATTSQVLPTELQALLSDEVRDPKFDISVPDEGPNETLIFICLKIPSVKKNMIDI